MHFRIMLTSDHVARYDLVPLASSEIRGRKKSEEEEEESLAKYKTADIIWTT